MKEGTKEGRKKLHPSSTQAKNRGVILTSSLLFVSKFYAYWLHLKFYTESSHQVLCWMLVQATTFSHCANATVPLDIPVSPNTGKIQWPNVVWPSCDPYSAPHSPCSSPLASFLSLQHAKKSLAMGSLHLCSLPPPPVFPMYFSPLLS